MKSSLWVIFSLVLISFSSCDEKKSRRDSLPILGRFEVVKSENGSVDTLHHKVSDFEFQSQLGDTISLREFENSIYVADFFFTTCPDICPTMKAQMTRVYDEYKTDSTIKFLSHTIDPGHDSVSVLYEFAENMGVDHKKWFFVTGKKTEIYRQGQVSYMASISDDPRTGLTHSGRFFLIDMERRVRGAYDGTNPVEVNDLIKDISRLKKEYE